MIFNSYGLQFYKLNKLICLAGIVESYVIVVIHTLNSKEMANPIRFNISTSLWDLWKTFKQRDMTLSLSKLLVSVYLYLL